LLQYIILFIPLTVALLAVLRPDLFAEAFAKTPQEWLSALDPLAATVMSLIGLGGGTLLAGKIFLPFRLQFKKLYDVKDQSKRIGFIDEFTKEFKLYREAVGPRKFLIIIDDLDRCAPDQVVEVLKTINLITTSGDGAERSFFLLGYDPKYIVRSIEQHFKEYAAEGAVVDRFFGMQYLKKMVTLNVSVPSVESDKVHELLKAINAKANPAPASAHKRTLVQRMTEKVTSTPVWAIKAAVAATVCIVLAIVLTQRPETLSSRITAGAPVGIDQAGEVFTGEKRWVNVPVSEPKPLPAAPWSSWVPTVLAGGLLVMYLIYRVWVRPAVRSAEYVQEAEDSAAFTEAVAHCSAVLPENPRDAIRLINRMRFEYLIQEQTDASVQAKLNEEECVTFTLMHYRHPGFLNPEFLDEEILPHIQKDVAHDPVKLYEDLSRVYPSLDKLKSEIMMLREATVDVSHFGDVAKLSAYVRLNRYLLEAQRLVAIEGESADATEHVNVDASLADVHVMENPEIKSDAEYASTS
jgi:hypothetical protein